VRAGARPLRAIAGAGLGIAVLLLAGPIVVANAAPAARQDAAPGLTLTGESPGIAVGGTFALSVHPVGLPSGASVQLTIHDRVLSRSELATSIEGSGLRRGLHTNTSPVASLPADADGTLHLTVSLAPSTAAGRAISTPGVYPTEVTAVDGAGATLASFITDLVLWPAASAAAPPLDVAVLAEVTADPRPPDQPAAAAETIAGALGLANALAAVPDVPVTLAARPETVDSIATSTSPAATTLLTALRGVAATHPVLALPYVATSPDELATAGLADELPHLVEHGTSVLQRLLGTTPQESAWLAESDLGGSGLPLLSALGVREAIVDPARVETVTGVLTPARPFLLGLPRNTGRTRTNLSSTSIGSVEALLTDVRLAKLLGDQEPPALLASHVLADLAALWFEQPGTRRSVVLPIPLSVDGGAVRQILEGLRSPAQLRPVPISQAFSDAAPLLGSDGTMLRRSLTPSSPMSIVPATVTEVRAVRSLRDSVQGMLGASSKIVDEIDGRLLGSMSVGLSNDARRAELAAARGAVQHLANAIQTPRSVTITLTARDGTVPLTIRNDTGAPVQAQVRLHSPKIQLPGGDTIPVTLTGPSTRLDIAVRTRASGAFPIQVEVTSPDGLLLLASTRYSVRSTAVSGLGLILSAGAGLFLIVWWARHWREARRSAKLVNSAHPAVAGPKHRARG
jgi:hypothetical protein